MSADSRRAQSRLRRREDSLSEAPYVLLGGTPVDRVPVQVLARWSVHRVDSDRGGLRRSVRVRRHGVQLALRFRHHQPPSFPGQPDPRRRPFGPGHQSRIRPVARSGHREVRPPRSGFLLPFGRRHSLAGSSCARWGIVPPLRPAYRRPAWSSDPIGVVTLPTHELRPGWAPSKPRGRRCPRDRHRRSGRRLPPPSGPSLHLGPASTTQGLA